MYENLHHPFPYRDIDKMKKDLSIHFSQLTEDEDWLSADFNEYCTNIAGTLNYCLEDLVNEIPVEQIERLKFSFFETYKQYQFLEEKIAQYNEFYSEYQRFEKARKWLLVYLHNN